MAVSVQFEIGHTAKLRAKKTPEGFTHDWELYVRGTNKADISAYVDKVVFNLHESFQKPKRVYKEPPYVVHESGYASFVLTVDIHFRNRDEPKRVQYPYDLDLQPHGPPHHRSEEKRFVFENPSEEFKQKLLKGGGVPVVPAGLTGSRSGHTTMTPSNFVESSANVQQSSTAVAGKHKTSSTSSGSVESSTKKHKSRSDDAKLNTFANLFGPLDPSSKSSSIKAGADVLKNPNNNNSSSNKILSPNASLGLASAGVSSLKDRSGKDTKEKQPNSGSAEKSKEKSERKEKHKSSSTSSPNKDGRGDTKKSSTSSASNAEAGKPEKQRSEDKPKKDKIRDKDKERSSSGTATSSSGNLKSTSSSKAMPNTAVIASSTTSLPRPSTHNTVSGSSINRTEEKNASTKPDKETKEKHNSSSSSGKRSKKDKKDKDKEREKDKEKEKRDEKQRNSGGIHDSKSKEERSFSGVSQSNLSGSPSGQSTPNSSVTAQAQVKPPVPLTIVGNSSSNLTTKKTEKETKSTDCLKIKQSEKTSEKSVSGAITTSAAPAAAVDKKSATPNSSNSGSNSTKSHKHKKKDKNKEKDKEKDKDRVSLADRDKEKTKEKHKDKVEEKKETEKSSDALSNKFVGATSNEAKKPVIISHPVPIVAGSTQSQMGSGQVTTSNSNISECGGSNKKSQNKEKKSKDSKNSKDIKRRSEASTPTASIGAEPKSKVIKTSTPLSTAGSNIELSDADSRQSAHENINKPALAPVASDLHSDSSYSSFPDISVKPKEMSALTPSASSISSEKTSKTLSAAPGSKENKRDKEVKSSTKCAEKVSKQEKDDKKRRRNAVTNDNTFIEPPVKQAKKEQNKSSTTRDTTKSPLPLRNSNTTKSGKSQNETNLFVETTDTQPQLAQTSINVTASTAVAVPATLLNTNVNAIANHANNSNPNSAVAQRSHLNIGAAHPASPALSSTDTLWPNLSELQELHHKIMTLQDNQELQQIVEMIAASGCYEVTQRTFDFDLCKLDRSTVERLQEFFATSVS